MLTVVCFKWKPARRYRSVFEAEHVLALQRMVAKHYRHPHRFLCITDDTTGLRGQVETYPLWHDYADVPSPHGGDNPSCYRRLRLFASDAGSIVGDRFVCVDLDTVIVRDVSPLWDRPEDFVICGETDPRSFYNGSMFLLRTGTRAKVWDTFNPRISPQRAMLAGKFGSDQGWLSYCLGKGEAMWGKSDGVYSWRLHLAPKGGGLPGNARIVMFHGRVDPWHYDAQQHPWIRQHYGAPDGVSACA